MTSAFEEWWASARSDSYGAESTCAIARLGWNAALEAAKAQMPRKTESIRRDNWDDGWNGAIRTMDERLSALQEPDAREDKT